MTVAPDGTPVVLLHPIGLDATFWEGTAPPGAVALDFPGFGSAPREEHVTIPRLVDYVAAHIPTRATVVGLSLGGMIALETAIHRPDVVASLVVACAGAGGHPDVMRARAEATRRSGMEGILQTTLERWFTPEALATPAHPGVAYARRRLLDDDPETFARYWDAMAAHDVSAVLGSIQVPVTVVAGARDRASSVASLQEMAAAIPGADFSVLDGPHLLPLERPDDFRDVLDRHLRTGVR